MVTFVSTEWVSQHLANPAVLIVDPRTRMKHLAGHPQGAVSFPMSELFDAAGALRPEADLAAQLGAAGVDNSRTLVLYDSPDGQKVAMVAWTLTYLGARDVRVMSEYYERWVEECRPVFYRQHRPEAAAFEYEIRPDIRAGAEDVLSKASWKRLDVRSPEEFQGTSEADEVPGRIPEAVHLDWRELSCSHGSLLASEAALNERLEGLGIGPNEPVVAYCRSGSRASLAWLALSRAGRTVRLYDGSYRDWTERGLPVETG